MKNRYGKEVQAFFKRERAGRVAILALTGITLAGFIASCGDSPSSNANAYLQSVRAQAVAANQTPSSLFNPNGLKAALGQPTNTPTPFREQVVNVGKEPTITPSSQNVKTESAKTTRSETAGTQELIPGKTIIRFYPKGDPKSSTPQTPITPKDYLVGSLNENSMTLKYQGGAAKDLICFPVTTTDTKLQLWLCGFNSADLTQPVYIVQAYNSEFTRIGETNQHGGTPGNNFETITFFDENKNKVTVKVDRAGFALVSSRRQKKPTHFKKKFGNQ